MANNSGYVTLRFTTTGISINTDVCTNSMGKIKMVRALAKALEFDEDEAFQAVGGLISYGVKAGMRAAKEEDK